MFGWISAIFTSYIEHINCAFTFRTGSYAVTSGTLGLAFFSRCSLVGYFKFCSTDCFQPDDTTVGEHDWRTSAIQMASGHSALLAVFYRYN